MEGQAKRFYFPNEVKEITGLSRLTIIRHLESGKIPGKKIGGRWLIPASYLESLESDALANVCEAR